MASTAHIKFPVLLGKGDFSIWFQALCLHCVQFGSAGKGILCNINNKPLSPQSTDMLLDADGKSTVYHKFEHKPVVHDGAGTIVSPFEFIGDGLKDYKKAIANFAAVEAAYNVGNDRLAQFLLLHCCSDVQKDLQGNAAFCVAYHQKVSDTFLMLSIMRDLYSKGNAQTGARQLSEFCHLKQGNDSHETYVDNVKRYLATVVAIYGSSTYPGFMSIDQFACAVYINGLDQDALKFKLEQIYNQFPTGQFSNLPSLMDGVQIYSRQYRNETKSSAEYASALVASSVSESSRKCATCLAPIPVYHKFCSPCFRDSKSKNQVSAKPGPIVKKPTAAQQQAARAMVAAPDPLVLDDSEAED